MPRGALLAFVTIAKRFGVNAATVQRISLPFDGAAA
jgi:hypothetical protein